MISEPGKTSNWLFEISLDKAFGCVSCQNVISPHILKFWHKAVYERTRENKQLSVNQELTEEGVKL